MPSPYLAAGLGVTTIVVTKVSVAVAMITVVTVNDSVSVMGVRAESVALEELVVVIGTVMLGKNVTVVGIQKAAAILACLFRCEK